jgi:leucyl-tRNA synthetase
MSKSKANGVSPVEIFDKYGADVVRIHIAFKAPIEKDMVWDTQGIKGIQRFVRRVEGFTRSHSQDRDPQMQSAFEEFARGVESDMEQFALNTAIAKMMAFSRQVARFQDSKEKDCAISYIQEVAKVFAGEG